MPVRPAVLTRVLFAFLVARGSLSLASTMLTVALGWHLYQISGDAFDLALVGLMQILPIYLFFFASGWAVDHFRRDQLVRVSAVVEWLAYLGIAWVMVTPEPNRWALFALIFMQGSAKSFSSPALQAILPNIVPADRLNQAVAMASTTWNLAMTAGPAAAGFLILWVDRGVYWAMAICVTIALLSYMALPPIRVEKALQRGIGELAAGLRFVFAKPLLLGSLSLDLLAVGLGSVMVLLPIYATDILNVGPDELGIMRATPALGAVLMGLWMSRSNTEITRAGPKLFATLLVFSISIGVFALSSTYWLSLLALFAYGASDMVSVNIRMTLVQLATPDALRGRVSAVNSLFISSSNEAGDFRGGAMAAALGPVFTATAGAAMALAVTLWGYRAFPTLFRLNRLDEVKPD